MAATSAIFNNGLKFPLIGLGTFRSEPGVLAQVVKDAIDIGYRHFDCAYVYQNEKEVGEGIRQKIKEGVVKREELFITSKLWNSKHEKEKVIPALKTSLKQFGLDYLDLYLIHWPVSFKEVEGDDFPTNSEGDFLCTDLDNRETWKEMEKCVKAGLTKSIGLSNFNKQQTLEILEVAEIKPVNNQVECHPYLNQSKLIEFCNSVGIVVSAYCPLGRPSMANSLGLLDDPVVKEIAQKHEKTPGQIIIRYQIQRGVSVLPKTVTLQRLKSNFEVFDFNINDADMRKIDSLDRGERCVPFSQGAKSKYFPFAAEC